MNYIITAELREALLNYLGSRPYSEVAAGVQALQNLQQLDGEG